MQFKSESSRITIRILVTTSFIHSVLTMAIIKWNVAKERSTKKKEISLTHMVSISNHKLFIREIVSISFQLFHMASNRNRKRRLLHKIARRLYVKELKRKEVE